MSKSIKYIVVFIFIMFLFGSCRSSYQMPNDTFKHNGKQYKWYEHQNREINKTVHRPRWANN